MIDVSANEWHFVVVGGPNNGKCLRFRRNGETKTWKQDANRFRIPIKYGLRTYGAITEENEHNFHNIADCPNKSS